MSHAGYLRELWEGEWSWLTLVRGLQSLGEEADGIATRELEPVLRERLTALTVGAPAGDSELLLFVALLTLRPRGMTEAHLDPLRAAGFDDEALHDITNVACCFSYMNRLADGLGVLLEQRKFAVAEDLFGADALAAHLDWGTASAPR